MKNLFLIKIVCILSFLPLSCTAQSSKFEDDYNIVTPKLNRLADKYAKIKGGTTFQDFFKLMEEQGLEPNFFGYSGKTSISKEIYLIDFWFTDWSFTAKAVSQQYQVPWVRIKCKERVSDMIKNLALKYHGDLSSEVKTFLAPLEIESIDFIGINGFKNLNRSSRHIETKIPPGNN